MREPFFQPHLQRVVIGENAVLHPLNIAEGGILPWSGRLCSVRVRDHGERVDVAESRQLGAFISDVADIEQKVARQFTLDSKVELLDVRASLVGILSPALYCRVERVRIEQPLWIAVSQAERCRGRDGC